MPARHVGRRPLAILAVTIGLAVATFLVVDARTDDVSGRTPGTAALVVVAIGIVVLVVAQRSGSCRVSAARAWSPKLVGRTVLRGERHGRQVTVTLAGGRTETHVAAPGTSEAWLFDLWLAERLAGAQPEGAITASP